MTNVILALHLLVAVAMVGLVLMQRSEGGALGIGGGSGSLLSGRGAANALARGTSLLAAFFFLTSVSLTLLSGRSHAPKSVIDTTPITDTLRRLTAKPAPSPPPAQTTVPTPPLAPAPVVSSTPEADVAPAPAAALQRAAPLVETPAPAAARPAPASVKPPPASAAPKAATLAATAQPKPASVLPRPASVQPKPVSVTPAPIVPAAAAATPPPRPPAVLDRSAPVSAVGATGKPTESRDSVVPAKPRVRVGPDE
jgi:preprotein translocase subunit SecG